MYDIAIVGAGPAGLTAAIYALRMNLSVVVFEGMSYGGQIANAAEIGNYPGYSSISGFELATNLYEQALHLGLQMISSRIDDIKIKSPKSFILSDYENNYEAKSVILATGVRRRLLDIPGEETYKGLGVSYCATCDGAFYKNKDVCVVGGGNTALGEALHLARLCRKVYLIHRRDEFRGNQLTLQRIKQTENIEVITNAIPQEICGDEKVKSIICKDVHSGNVRVIELSGVFVAVGQEPDTLFLDGIVNKDESGYIIACEDCETSQEGIFVAGDCRKKEVRQLTTATSDGTVAAIRASKYIAK